MLCVCPVSVNPFQSSVEDVFEDSRDSSIDDTRERELQTKLERFKERLRERARKRAQLKLREAFVEQSFKGRQVTPCSI